MATDVPPFDEPPVGLMVVMLGMAAKADGTATTVNPAPAITVATTAFASIEKENQRERNTPIDPNPRDSSWLRLLLETAQRLAHRSTRR